MYIIIDYKNSQVTTLDHSILFIYFFCNLKSLKYALVQLLGNGACVCTQSGAHTLH